MSDRSKSMNVTALASWFGTNRTFAEYVGKELEGCAWVGIPFAGSMCEVPHIGARTIQVNDLHRHVINLARVAADDKLGRKLYRRLRRLPYHPVALAGAQSRCREREATGIDPYAGGTLWGPRPFDICLPDLEWAEDYFICAWMTRHGSAGTPAEFTAGPSLRWNANGGDSAAHFHNAVRELPKWRRALRRCNFTTLDCFDFLAKCKDEDGHGIYSDSPFPEVGEKYTHSFDEAKLRRLAAVLSQYRRARVVIRYHRHPLIEELYPRDRWTYVERVGRTQTNKAADEWLILNGASCVIPELEPRREGGGA